jgi:hypothetical protein
MPGILVQIAEPHHWGDAYKFLSPLWGMSKVCPFLSESIPVRVEGLKVKKSIFFTMHVQKSCKYKLGDKALMLFIYASSLPIG